MKEKGTSPTVCACCKKQIKVFEKYVKLHEECFKRMENDSVIAGIHRPVVKQT